MHDGNNIDDICFKFTCCYMTITELFDRVLTDERSKNDPTEAFIDSNPTIKNLSKENAFLPIKHYLKLQEVNLIYRHIYFMKISKNKLKLTNFLLKVG